jgi:hypothetical protein
MLPPVFVELKANISEFTAAMGEARGEMASVEAQGMSSFDKLAGFGKAALFGLGAAAVGVGALSVEMADKFEQSHAKLEQALKNAGTSFEKYKDQIGAAQKSMEQYGFTNAQTQEALANLTTSLGDPKKALDSLSLAADLAKYKHIDLAEASIAVAKAQEGNLRPLKQLGIDLPVAAGGAVKLETAQKALAAAQEHYNELLGKSSAGHEVSKGSTEAVTKAQEHYNDVLAVFNSHATHTVAQQIALKNAAEKVNEAQAKLSETHVVGATSSAALEAAHQKLIAAQEKVNTVSSAGKDIMDGLSKAIGGQAAASAETFTGKMAALKAQSEDVAKNIGMALIPILEKLVTVIKDVVDWFTKHKAIAEAIAFTIGGVLVAAIGAYLSTLAKAAIESVIAFAKMIGSWVGLGEAATVAGEEATVAGAEIGVATGGMTIALGLVAAAVLYLATHWKQVFEGIQNVIKDAWDWINKHALLVAAILGPLGPIFLAIRFLADNWKQIWDGIKDVTSGAWNFIEGIVNTIGNGIRGMIGLIKNEINGLISLVNKAIKTIDSISVDLPFGMGHIGFNIPEIPMLAEGGIVTKPTLAMIGEAGAEAVIPLSKGGMGGINVVVNVQGSVVQEQDLAVSVRDQIAILMRRRGLNPSILGV